MNSAVTLGYESIQFSPYVTDHPIPLARQIAAAAGAGFQWLSFDTWSLKRHTESGGTVEELGMHCTHTRFAALSCKLWPSHRTSERRLRRQRSLPHWRVCSSPPF